MRKLLLFLCLVPVLPVLISFAKAADDPRYKTTFDYLYEQCLLKEDFCVGYLSGIAQIRWLVSKVAPTGENLFAICSGGSRPPNIDDLIRGHIGLR